MPPRRRTTRPRRCPRGGFTLIELLVVIGLLGILMGLLMPALSKARAKAAEVQCASILRQWGHAFHVYATQFHGLLPHSGDETRNPFFFQNRYDPAHPQNESCYLDVLPPLLHRRPWKSYPFGQKPTDDIWQCPLAEVLDDAAYGYQPSLSGYHTFAMNQYLDVGPPVYSHFLNLAKARQSSVTLLMFEVSLRPNQCFGQNPVPVACLVGLYPNDNPRALGDRHPHLKGKLGGNLLMLDGHVEWTDHLWDPALPDPAQPPLTNRTWWPY